MIGVTRTARFFAGMNRLEQQEIQQALTPHFTTVANEIRSLKERKYAHIRQEIF